MSWEWEKLDVDNMFRFGEGWVLGVVWVWFPRAFENMLPAVLTAIGVASPMRGVGKQADY